MKLKHLLTALFAAAILAAPVMAADDETPLDKEMEKANKAYKLVKRNLADAAQKEANVAKIAEVKASFEKAADLEPAKAKDIPAADKAKFVADYKAAIKDAIKDLDALKAAIEAGKTDEAAKLIEKLDGDKKEGHKKFKKED